MSLEIIEVDQFTGGHSHEGRGLPTVVELSETSLQNARSLVGTILTPSFLPDSYALEAVAVFRDRDVYLTYADSSTTGAPPLLVNLVRKARPKVKSGHVEPASIGHLEGHLIHGTWEQSDNAVAWNRDAARTLAFERDGWVVIIIGPEGFDTQTLFRVGESLA